MNARYVLFIKCRVYDADNNNKEFYFYHHACTGLVPTDGSTIRGRQSIQLNVSAAGALNALNLIHYFIRYFGLNVIVTQNNMTVNYKSMGSDIVVDSVNALTFFITIRNLL